MAGRSTGRTVVVTRPREQAASLAEPLEHLGAEVLLAPTIRIVPPHARRRDRARRRQRSRRTTAWSSSRAPTAWTSSSAISRSVGLPLAAARRRHRGGRRAGTASALEERGVTCDVVADEFVAEGLLDTLEERAAAPAGTRVLIPSARLARAVLPDALRASGARRERAAGLRHRARRSALQVPAARIESRRLHHLHVRLYGAAVRPRSWRRGRRPAAPAARRAALRRGLCSIGPVTSDTLRELGLPVAVEAVRAHLRRARGGDRRLRLQASPDLAAPATLRRCA